MKREAVVFIVALGIFLLSFSSYSGHVSKNHLDAAPDLLFVEKPEEIGFRQQTCNLFTLLTPPLHPIGRPFLFGLIPQWQPSGPYVSLRPPLRDYLYLDTNGGAMYSFGPDTIFRNGNDRGFIFYTSPGIMNVMGDDRLIVDQQSPTGRPTYLSLAGIDGLFGTGDVEERTWTFATAPVYNNDVAGSNIVFSMYQGNFVTMLYSLGGDGKFSANLDGNGLPQPIAGLDDTLELVLSRSSPLSRQPKVGRNGIVAYAVRDQQNPSQEIITIHDPGSDQLFNNGNDVVRTISVVPASQNPLQIFDLSTDGTILTYARMNQNVATIGAYIIGADGRLGTADDVPNVLIQQLGQASIDRIATQGLSDDGTSQYRIAAIYNDQTLPNSGPYLYYHDAQLPGAGDDVHIHQLITLAVNQGVYSLSMYDKAVLITIGLTQANALLWNGC